jgi:hypothetical protein
MIIFAEYFIEALWKCRWREVSVAVDWKAPNLLDHPFLDHCGRICGRLGPALHAAPMGQSRSRCGPSSGNADEVWTHFYVARQIRWFVENDLWIFFGLFGLVMLIMLSHRDKIERVR